MSLYIALLACILAVGEPAVHHSNCVASTGSKAQPHKNEGGSSLMAKAIDPTNGMPSDDKMKDSFHRRPNPVTTPAVNAATTARRMAGPMQANVVVNGGP